MNFKFYQQPFYVNTLNMSPLYLFTSKRSNIYDRFYELIFNFHFNLINLD
jgi:hypothetical protein